MKTKFNSVAEAAAQLAGNPEIEKKVKQEIGRNSLVSLLLEMRVSKGLTQEDMAQAMGCDASTISRIESENDRALKWTDVTGYANALKVQMSVMFDDESLPASARIKQCVLKIDEDLKKLACLAEKVGGDDKIAQEINRFYKQVLFNFLANFSENHSKVQSIVKIPVKPHAALADRKKAAPQAETVCEPA